MFKFITSVAVLALVPLMFAVLTLAAQIDAGHGWNVIGSSAAHVAANWGSAPVSSFGSQWL